MNDSQGHLKTPTPYSDKGEYIFDINGVAYFCGSSEVKEYLIEGKTEFERVACEDPVSACVGYNLPKLMEKADGEYLLFVQTAHNNHKKDLIAAYKTDFRMNVTLIKLLERQVENAGKRIAELESTLDTRNREAGEMLAKKQREIKELEAQISVAFKALQELSKR